jgi:hypothetical protein
VNAHELLIVAKNVSSSFPAALSLKNDLSVRISNKSNGQKEQHTTLSLPVPAEETKKEYKNRK